MNKIQSTLISYIREKAEEEHSELNEKFKSMTDDAMVRLMFSNYRGKENSRGLRLTKFGLQLMKRYFQGIEIPQPAGKKILPLHLIYLDRKATLPYYSNGDENIVTYDLDLGMKLKLADGNVDTLIFIESES